MENVTRMIIVTDYHANGSLYDYLETRTLTEEESLRLVLSGVSGLVHLHTEISGGPSTKPGIAHRDLKSKNILIKRNGEACIADFGLSVCSTISKGVDRIPMNIQSGTIRYMPPEVLNNSIQSQWFESYKQADIYSFSLILWEICTRSITTDKNKLEFEDYSVPYYNHTSPDPSIDEMKLLVCDGDIRPTVSSRWANSVILSNISNLMQECWHSSPQARLSALRIKKTLNSIHSV